MRPILAAAALIPMLTALVVVVALTAGPAFSASLSPSAELIVSTAKAGSDLNAICADRGKLKAELTTVTKSLMASGKLSGNPRSDAMAAGKYISMNCGKL